jgi:hypothetical protein
MIASRLSHLPYILPSVAAACFWLVVVWAVVDRRLSKAVVYFMFIYFFVAQFDVLNDGTVSPHALSRTRASTLKLTS